MFTEDEIRKEFAKGNYVCTECKEAIMQMKYDSEGNEILICPNPDCEYEIMKKWYTLDDEWPPRPDDEEYDQPDEGCIACGAPYPQCKSSCVRFDD